MVKAFGFQVNKRLERLLHKFLYDALFEETISFDALLDRDVVSWHRTHQNAELSGVLIDETLLVMNEILVPFEQSLEHVDTLLHLLQIEWRFMRWNPEQFQCQ